MADWLLHPVMSLSLVAPNLWIHYPPPSFVAIPIIITVSPTLSSLSFILHLQSSSIALRTGKGWVCSSKHLHLQNSSIFPAVSKKGGFIHPNISISKIHPFSLQFPKWVGLFIQISSFPSQSPEFIHFLRDSEKVG